jgi:flavin reductase (DIM6/NTAB) family NADH-FMN oxidoreductase RutF
MLCFAPGRRSKDGDRKDTLSNIEATGEFVVNVVTEEIGAAMHETGADFPPDVDEFEIAGLTPEPSRMVKPPRVKESPINMECKVYDILHFGGDKPTGGALVIGEIILFDIADEVYVDGRIDYRKLKPLGRLAGDDYTALGRIISHKRKKL